MVTEECSWGSLQNFRLTHCGIVYGSRKPQLPENLRKLFRPCSINIDVTTLMRQYLLIKATEDSILEYNSSAPVYSHVISFYLSKCSDATSWRNEILHGVQRIDENTWQGYPTSIVIYDAATPEQRDCDCISMIDQIRSSIQDVEWVFPLKQGAGEWKVIYDLPEEVSELTIVHLPILYEEFLAPLQHEIQWPLLQAANSEGATYKMVLSMFSVDQIEIDFPRLYREAKKFHLDPWWLQKAGLLKRSGIDDPDLNNRLVETFLTKLISPGVLPDDFHHFVKGFLTEFNNEELAQEKKDATELLDSLNYYRDLIIIGTALSSEQMAKHVELVKLEASLELKLRNIDLTNALKCESILSKYD